MLGFQFSTLVQMQWDRNIVPCSMQVVRNVMDDQEGQADSKGDIIENLSRWVILHVFDLMISHIRPNWTHAVLDRHRGGQEEVFFRVGGSRHLSGMLLCIYMIHWIPESHHQEDHLAELSIRYGDEWRRVCGRTV